MNDNAKEFDAMSREDKVNMVKQITEIATGCGFSLKVQIYTETVCQLFGQKPQVMAKQVLRASKELPSTDEEKVNAFNEQVKPLVDGVKGVEVNVVAKLGAGDMYKTIENVMPFDSDAPAQIIHNEGQVILLDFWATWCPPCQKPMAHNQEMLEKRKADWAGKVRIVGVSIDQSKDKMVAHVNNKGWTSVEHYHRHESNCSDVYNVRGVPHVILIDTHGRMVFIGHPATRKDLEADIDTLLKGEPLTGEGAWVDGAANAEGPAEEKDEEMEGFKDLDSEAVATQVTDFKTNAERWCNDEALVEKTKGMARNFCVMTVEENYDAKSGKMLTKFQNHRVVVGPQEGVDTFKAMFANEVKGDFEVKEQYHVIPAQ